MNLEKRRTIIVAAEALFSRCRFHEITMEAVAREAGVGKGTLYRYFADKEALYFEVALAGHEALCQRVEAEASRAGCFREKLTRVSAALAVFFRRRHRAWSLMQVEERRQLMGQGRLREAWCQRQARLRQALVGVFEDGLAAGEVRSDVPLAFLAGALLGLLRGQAREESGEDGGGAGAASLVVDLFLNGARPRSKEREA